MKIIEIVASVANLSHGPSYSVPRLAEGVAAAGGDVELFTVGAPGHETRKGVLRRTFAHDLAGLPRIGHLRLSGAMRRALSDQAAAGAVLHTHGLWLAPNLYPADAARKAGGPFVISPRGMLGEAAMSFSSLQKRLFWAAFQHRAMASADFIHATSTGELAEIRAMGLSNPVAVIPNGVDIPPAAQPPQGAVRIALSLGRIHPKKGLDRLVRAWALAGAATEGWRLKIIGPSEMGHADALKALAGELGLTNVEVSGPLFDDAKLAAYREASLFVLPTLNENFAMTVAEALAAGTPVISTRGAPWSGLEVEGCGWWIDHGQEAMAATLATALTSPAGALTAMGQRGRAWMQRDFSWDHIGRRMLAAYEWAVAGGAPPSEIVL